MEAAARLPPPPSLTSRDEAAALRGGNEEETGCGLRVCPWVLRLGPQRPRQPRRSRNKPLWGHPLQSLGVTTSASTSLSVLLASPAPPALTDLPPSSLAGTDALGHDAPPAAVCSGAACVTGPSLLHLLRVSARHGPTLLPPEEDTWAPPGWGEVGERGRQSQGHSGQAPGVFSWQQVCPLWPPSVLELATTKSILSRSSRLQEGTWGPLSPVLQKPIRRRRA